MSGTTMVVLIVLISVGFGVFSDLYRKHLAHKKYTHNANDVNKKLLEELTTLKARVAVLEKIVTDEGYEVKRNINRL